MDNLSEVESIIKLSSSRKSIPYKKSRKLSPADEGTDARINAMIKNVKKKRSKPNC